MFFYKMSQDIRSFFTIKGKTSTLSSKPKEQLEKNVKRKVNKIDSDSDEDIPKPTTSKKLQKGLNEIDSKQLENLFGVTPQLKKLKKTKEENIKIYEKEDSFKERTKNKTTPSLKEDFHKSDKGKTQKTDNEQDPKSDKTRTRKLDKEKIHILEKDEENQINDLPEKKIDDISEQDNLNETILPNSAKKNNFANYQRYLARGKPKNLGNKIIPEGRPGCLVGLTFVITGVLDSLERDDAAELIKKYDGRVTQSVSKNTSYILIGEEPGESKLNKAKTLGTKQITEDELLEKIKLSKEKEISPVAEKNIKSKSSQKKKETLTPKQKNKKPNTTISQTEKKIEDNKTNTESAKSSIFEEKKYEMIPQSSLMNISSCSQLWVDKYKPSSLSQLIGPKTEKSNSKKLFKWLQEWQNNNKSSRKTSRVPFNDMAMKAALLSGSPGIGKTTTAHLVCKELNYDVIEFNASDTRSQRLLREQVEQLLSSKSISNLGRDKNTFKNKVLIMDEVDGMAGNEDRGGVAELINLIKHTKIPIICICNDRQHPKIRSLVHYCLDLRFYKLNLEPIRSAMMSICFKEKIDINAKALDQIIMATNHDVRQTLHNLSLWSSAGKAISVQDAEKESARNKKVLRMGPWDVTRKIFSSSENQSLSLNDKNDLFFQDYDLGPLFIQENYLHVQPDQSKGNIRKTLDCLALTADSISMGDIIDKQIRTYNRWNLLPLKGIHSTIIPSHHMSGRIGNMINFPSFFGKNSKRVKFYRILKELQYHTQLKVSGNLESFNLDYAQPLKDKIYNSLFKEKMEGVKPCLDFMLDYNILRSDIENLIEITSWDSKDLWSTIDSKVKAALTREFNKSSSLIPFSISSEIKKKRKSPEEFDDNQDEEEEEPQDDDSKLKLDPMIKERKRKAPANQSKEPSAAKKRKVTNKKN